jgi:hypothetical protein
VNSGTTPTTSNGIYLRGGTTLASSKAIGTAISISGNSAGNAPGAGLYELSTALVIVKATGGGNINISNTASGTGSNRDLWFGNARVLASTGDITINSNVGVSILNTATGGTIIGKLTGHVDSSSSNITINTNNATSYDNLSFDTSGQVTIQPFGSSFTGLTTGKITWAPSITGLTLGKSGNTGNIAVASAISISGPIAIYSSGTVTQTAALTAPSLALYGNSGVGNFTLNHASNNIGTVAASGVGNLSYWDSNALTIGTVGTTNGIVATGTVDIQTLTGDLTVAQNVSTTNTTSSAVLLNAGKSAAAGTASGGNLLISGTPTLSVGTGGTAKLFSGSISGSTGLTALVGSGSGRFRYKSDESATNYTTALATGLNAIYRESPNVSGTISSATITYGDVTPTFTMTGGALQNGDGSSGLTIVSAAYSTANLLKASGTSYAVSATGLSGLGYTVSGVTNGALTVNTKALTVSGLSSANKVYADHHPTP